MLLLLPAVLRTRKTCCSPFRSPVAAQPGSRRPVASAIHWSEPSTWCCTVYVRESGSGQEMGRKEERHLLEADMWSNSPRAPHQPHPVGSGSQELAGLPLPLLPASGLAKPPLASLRAQLRPSYRLERARAHVLQLFAPCGREAEAQHRNRG